MLEFSVLGSLTAVLVQGADARKYMQGQLSNDVRKLTPQRALLGSYNTGQGRVQAVVTLLEREEGLVALFPSATLEGLLGRLRRSIYSTKVSLESLPWRVAAASAAQAMTQFGTLPLAPGDCVSVGVTLLRWWSHDDRYLLIAPQASLDGQDPDSALHDRSWRRDDIAAGLPQIYPETQSSFVPQMLNLDLVGGVSFDKGCYVGQEVVARARRGGVARRMFRFTAGCVVPAPGTRVMGGAEDVGEVVDAVAATTGSELLAVVNLDALSGRLSLAGMAESVLTLAALPYEVPLVRR